MTKYVIGIVGALLGLLGGLWLMLAPFAQGYQLSGANWADATKADFWTGIALVIISVGGIVLYTLALVEELRSRGIIERRVKPQPQQPQEAAPQAASQGNIEQMLVPLLNEMLKDMQEQRQRRNGEGSEYPAHETSQQQGRSTQQ